MIYRENALSESCMEVREVCWEGEEVKPPFDPSGRYGT